MQVLLATRNAGKLVELARILAPIEVLGLADVAQFAELPETGATYADNALIKAREAASQTGILALADHTGLAVVLSARWSGRAAVSANGDKLPSADQANVELLLAQLADVPVERRSASFRCAVALVTPDGFEVVTEAAMPGRIIDSPRGSNGFGYDPIFVPDGYEQTSAELSPDVKDRISHRGQALQAMVPELQRLLN
jgi:XTP/dITP diphosphohydrolase